MENRISGKLDQHQSAKQAGFQLAVSISQWLHTTRQEKEAAKCIENDCKNYWSRKEGKLPLILNKKLMDDVYCTTSSTVPRLGLCLNI
ncbi:unnamed protein product [Arctia plantaginis]|uniref:Uncharacterized protein n=1 Tax=Arctia plantaginis TaxID=874455 RepID=A0A8S1BRA9_ARCPL|nr:unnamed protein product [Arctia plantaginis]